MLLLLMTKFLKVTVSIINVVHFSPRSASDGPIQENSYSFLKRICQVFMNLGNLICALWVNFHNYYLPQR